MGFAYTFHNEILHYIVTYKWGIISKDSGEATISLTDHGTYYDIQLTGKTKPWADKFYMIRDTLTSHILKEGFKPQVYKKMSHEKDRNTKDIVTYHYKGHEVEGEAVRTKFNKKGEAETTTKLMTATGDVYDMLSIVYYIRSRDFDHMQDGDFLKTKMFSGSKVEDLHLVYLGKEKVTLRNKEQKEAYHVKFKFTKDNKKSSDDIDTWISTDSQHIPLLIVGNLAIGEIRCYYVP